MIQLSHPSRFWVYLILSLYLMVIVVTGMVLLVSGMTVLKVSALFLLISGMVLQLKPKLLLQTQEVVLGEGYMHLPQSDEKIPFNEIMRIKRSPFQAFYTVEMKYKKPVYFINLSIDHLDNLTFESEAEVLKKLRRIIKPARA